MYYYQDGNYAKKRHYVLKGYSALGDILDIMEYTGPVPLFIVRSLAIRMFERRQIETIYIEWEDKGKPCMEIIRRN